MFAQGHPAIQKEDPRHLLSNPANFLIWNVLRGPANQTDTLCYLTDLVLTLASPYIPPSVTFL